MKETYRMYGNLFVEHKQSTTNRKDRPVGEHIREADHSVNDMKVTVLLETYSGEKQRKYIEQHIISFL